MPSDRINFEDMEPHDLQLITAKTVNDIANRQVSLVEKIEQNTLDIAIIKANCKFINCPSGEYNIKEIVKHGGIGGLIVMCVLLLLFIYCKSKGWL